MDLLKLNRLVSEGLSGRKLADQLNCSQTAIRYWLKKEGLTTQYGKNPTKCVSCGETDIHKMMSNGENRVSRTRCKSCHNKLTISRGRANRKKLVDYLGGSCSVCGYCKYIEALDFHHLYGKDPGFQSIRYWDFERAKKELDKCILLCATHHREEHAKGWGHGESEAVPEDL